VRLAAASSAATCCGDTAAERRQPQPAQQQELGAVARQAGGAQRVLDQEAGAPCEGIGRRADRQATDRALGKHDLT
jgi:hypothetical protein